MRRVDECDVGVDRNRVPRVTIHIDLEMVHVAFVTVPEAVEEEVVAAHVDGVDSVKHLGQAPGRVALVTAYLDYDPVGFREELLDVSPECARHRGRDGVRLTAASSPRTARGQ